MVREQSLRKLQTGAEEFLLEYKTKSEKVLGYETKNYHSVRKII